MMRFIIKRLLREVLVWSHLNHRNVAAFYGLDFSGVNLEKLVNADVTDYHSEKGLQVPGLVSPFLDFGILKFVAERPDLREVCVSVLDLGHFFFTKRIQGH